MFCSQFVVKVQSNAKICCVQLQILIFNIETVDSMKEIRETKEFTNKMDCFLPIFKKQNVDLLKSSK